MPPSSTHKRRRLDPPPQVEATGSRGVQIDVTHHVDNNLIRWTEFEVAPAEPANAAPAQPKSPWRLATCETFVGRISFRVVRFTVV